MKSLLLLLAIGVAGCTPSGEHSETEDVPIVGIQNYVKITEKLRCGSTPDGAPGFDTLQALGIKTIISVDGTTPNVAEAERHNMRYVHIPLSYSGIPQDSANQLAKAVRELPGPVYVHCHHGRHRSPAACAVIQVMLEPESTPSQVEVIMTNAGTNPNYRGLFQAPYEVKRLTASELDAIPCRFPSIAPIADLTRRMVAIQECWDRLKLVQEAGWKPPASIPDIDAVHDCRLLVEHYRDTAQLDAAQSMPFADAEVVATALENAIRSGDPSAANAVFSRCANSCTQCHATYRDKPKK